MEKGLKKAKVTIRSVFWTVTAKEDATPTAGLVIALQCERAAGTR